MSETMVVLEMTYALEDLERDAFADVFHALVDEFDALEDAVSGFRDSSVSTDAHARTLTVEVTAVGSSYDDAEATAASCIRSAIPAAGGATSAWNRGTGLTEKTSRLVVA